MWLVTIDGSEAPHPFVSSGEQYEGGGGRGCLELEGFIIDKNKLVRSLNKNKKLLGELIVVTREY